jgi:hypothetical protein
MSRTSTVRECAFGDLSDAVTKAALLEAAIKASRSPTGGSDPLPVARLLAPLVDSARSQVASVRERVA